MISVYGETDLGAMPQRPLICMTSKDAVVGLPEDWPQNRNDFIRFFNGNLAYTLDLLANYGNKRLAYRLATGDWYEIATATPPQEFDLPLASGFSGTAKYSKDQFGKVLLTIDITGSYSNATVIGTLPAGFRPSETVTVLARIGGGFSTIDIDSTGEVKSYNISGSVSGAAFAQASFIASS